MSELREARVYEHPHEAEQDPTQQDFFEIFAAQLERERKERIKLGSGKAAHVWFTESPRFHERLCVKELHTPSASVNSLESEMRLHHDAFQAGVATPAPYFYIRTDRAEYMVMRRSAGVSVRDFVRAGGQPSEEQITRFRTSLTQQVGALHAKAHIHHRDLHDGNAMVLPDFSAELVDYGEAVWAPAVDDDMLYRGRVVREGRFVERILPRDEDEIEKVVAVFAGKRSPSKVLTEQAK